MKYILIPYAACTLILFGVDACFYLKDRYGRFHIGRWSNQQEWQNAIVKCAIRWTKKTPVVKKTDNSRYMLLDILQGEYESNTIQSWQIGSLVLGLVRNGDAKSQTAAKEAAEKTVDRNGNFITKPTNVDCGLLSYALLEVLPSEQIRPAMDFAAELIHGNVASDGMIAYTSKNSDERYVDTIGLTCPFLARYARVYQKPEFAQLAVRQLKLFSEYGLYRNSLLPNHAFSSRTKLPLGVYGWGRGAAWYVLGLIDTYFELPDGEDKNWLKTQVRQAADAYLQYQRADGGFGYILQMQQGYDSSATAALAYFYRRCSEIFENETYAACADSCLEKLRTVTKMTGAIDWCQGDTKGIGIFAQTYDIMPFAQGMAVRAMRK